MTTLKEMIKGLVILILLLMSCKDNPINPIPVNGVSIKSATSIGVGTTEQLAATISPDNATNKAVTWSSSTVSVATASATGLITGIAEGTSTITVTTVDGNFTAQCLVTVSKSAKVSISSGLHGNVNIKGDTTIAEGSTLIITAIATDTKYHFLKWSTTGNITIVKADSIGEFKINGNGTIKGHFQIIVIDDIVSNNTINEWVNKPDGICAKGTAKTVYELLDIIDGASFCYTTNGFIEAIFKGYSDGNNEMCVEIYNQGTKNNVSTLFKSADIATGIYVPVSSFGDTARLDTSLITDYEMHICNDKFFIRLSSKRKTENYKQSLLTLGKYISNKIGD